MVNVAVQTLPRKKHWSKSVFASELGKRDLVGAKKWLAGLKSDFDYTVANGADEFHEVGASKYLGMAPYIQQRIDELTTETSITQSSALSDVTAAAASTLLYWFSGTNLTTTGVQAQWHTVNGGECLYRETKIDPLHSLLSDSVYEGDLALIRSGAVAGVIFSYHATRSRSVGFDLTKACDRCAH